PKQKNGTEKWGPKKCSCRASSECMSRAADHRFDKHLKRRGRRGRRENVTSLAVFSASSALSAFHKNGMIGSAARPVSYCRPGRLAIRPFFSRREDFCAGADVAFAVRFFEKEISEGRPGVAGCATESAALSWFPNFLRSLFLPGSRQSWRGRPQVVGSR